MSAATGSRALRKPRAIALTNTTPRPSRLEVLIAALPAAEAELRALADLYPKLLQPSPDGNPAFDLCFSFPWRTSPQGEAFWSAHYGGLVARTGGDAA